MTIRADPESIGEHTQISCKPLPSIHKFWQVFSRIIHRVASQNVLIKFIHLLIVTTSLAAASFAGVTISSPQNGATVASPVHVVATATSSNAITSMRVYVDNVSVYSKAANRIDTLVSMAAGKHTIVVQAWDSKTTIFKSTVAITVGSAPPATPTPTPSASGVTISSPANGAIVVSPVHMVASASGANPITAMRIYVDSISVFNNTSNKIDTMLTMAQGPHTMVVQAWDSKGTVFKATITITVSSNATPTPTPGVTVGSPRNGGTLASPVHVAASAWSTKPITAMRIYLDGISVFANSTNKLDTTVNAATGAHNLTVQAWDSTGAVFKTPLTISVNPTTTLSAETDNNTSAADSFAAQSNGNAAAGNVSKVATRTLLHPGSAAKIYAHFLPWFGSPKHMSVGYISDDSQQIRKQVNDMVSRGLNGVIIDWYGIDPAGTDFLMIDHVTQLMMQEAEVHPGFSFAIMYDQGALAPCANTPGCDMTQRMIDDLNHVNVSYWNSPAYQKSGGRPVLYFFLNPLYTIDWARLRSGVAGNPLFIFPHETGFTHAESDGGFGWIKPELANTSDPAALAYLSLYYNTATSAARYSTGSGYPGFDDSLAPWGKHRKVGQQCGQTWLQTLDEAKNHYSTSNQMSGIQLVTWNDYEEGTEIETGIDNCVTVTPSVAGAMVSWNITGQATTLDHFSVYVSVAGGNLMWLKDAPVTASSMDLAQFNLEAGSYLVYVKAIGKPSLTNKMSSGVQMIAH